jgi:hypothetical protein
MIRDLGFRILGEDGAVAGDAAPAGVALKSRAERLGPGA